MTKLDHLAENEIFDNIKESIDEAKLKDVKIIDVRGETDITDTMIIATANSSTHMRSTSHRIITNLKKINVKGIIPEGQEGGDWIIIDAFDVIVHLFRAEVREYYSIEELWDTQNLLKSKQQRMENE